jgi:hypothetical protein
LENDYLEDFHRRYLDILELYVLQQAEDDSKISIVNGPLHYHAKTVKVQMKIFPGLYVGRHFRLGKPQPPNITTLDVYLWGCIQHKNE